MGVWGVGLVVGLWATILPVTEGVKLRVLPQQRECIQEVTTEVGQTITGSFVADSAPENVAHAQAANLFRATDRFDLTVVDPNMKTVYTTRRKADHRFEIPVDSIGTYTFCFYNQARTAAYVLYHAHVGHHVDHKRALTQHLDPLTDSVQNVREHIAKLKQEYYYQRARDEVHRRTNESTAHRVVFFSVLEAAALVCSSLAQVLYIRKQFSNTHKRVGV